MKMKRITAALLALGLMLGLGSCGQSQPYATGQDHPYAISEAIYQEKEPGGSVGTLGPFFPDSAQVFLSGPPEENRVYSPMNLYLALAMLSETVGGESRQQLLDLLDVEDLEGLRSRAEALWQDSYHDGEQLTSLLASALWMADGVEYIPETMSALAKFHHASAFQGPIGDPAYDEALRSWIDQQTNGFLNQKTQNLHFNDDTFLALVTTVYFRGRWDASFYPEDTVPETFHAPGRDLTCDFMHQKTARDYYWGEQFAAVSQSVMEGGTMWLVLPEEGVSAEALLEGEALYAFLQAGQQWDQRREAMVSLALPKFDISTTIALQPGLEALGVTDVFDPARADFSPALVNPPPSSYLTTATHVARLLVDEEGCEAAAFTMLECGGDAFQAPEEEIDFILDRPFLFVLTSGGGLPLFAGVVNAPG